MQHFTARPLTHELGEDPAAWTTEPQRVSVPVGVWFPLAVVLLLEAAVRAGWIPAHLLPAPTTVLSTLYDLAASGALWQHVAASGTRIATGFAIGAVAGVVLGLATGLRRSLEAAFDPTFQALRAIPSLAWVPLLLLWLGIDEAPKIVLIAIGALFPVYLSVQSGVRNVDRKLVELAQAFGLGQPAIAWRVLLPASLPSLFTGLRQALSLSWMFLVAAELIAATRGIGYLLTDGRETGRADVVLAAIVVLAVLGKLSDGVLKFVEARALRWRDAFDPGAGSGQRT
ncbi:MAG: ABC transporter permease [Burkholderiales bacterium]|nr:ABC transporter permease [Burkholderiales bacterium]